MIGKIFQLVTRYPLSFAQSVSHPRRSAPPDLPEMLERMVAVGAVSERSARIWLRSTDPGPFELELAPEGPPDGPARYTIAQRGSAETDHTMSFSFPEDVPSAEPLRPATAYRFRLLASDGAPVGEGRFETAPAGIENTPEKFSFAFLSCHQPFGNDGQVEAAAGRMLEILEPILEQHGVKYVLLIGDQMYADSPDDFSLFNEEYFARIAPHGEKDILDCAEGDIRRIYQERYRRFWNHEAFLAFQRLRPIYCMLDDHEIVDNWGSAPEHAEPHWQKLGRAARAAFFDYQASRTLPRAGELPSSFHYELSFGTTGTFITDMRSERRTGSDRSQTFGEHQWEALESFLARHTDRHALFIVVTVPTLFVPNWIASWGVSLLGEPSDFADRWGWKKNLSDRDRFLRLLCRHQSENPDQRLVLLSGDVHVGGALVVDCGGENRIYQFISSAVTNLLHPLESVAARMGANQTPQIQLDGYDVEIRRLAPAASGQENPFTGLNLGIVEVAKSGAGSTVRFKLISHGDEEQAAPVVRFDSGEL